MTKAKRDVDVTDLELLKRTFPPDIRKALKATVDQLDAEKGQRKPKSKPKKR